VDYDWDEYNTTHLLVKHNVKRSEFEEVMRNNPIFRKEQVDERSGELRTVELGHTNDVRVLTVVWTRRGNLIRPVTAYDPVREIREWYLTQFYGAE